MTRYLFLFVLATSSTIGVRWALGQRGRREGVPEAAQGSAPVNTGGGVSRIPRRDGQREPSTHGELQSEVGQPEDLRRAEQLIGQMYGEPTPWDSVRFQSESRLGFKEAANEFEADGSGKLVSLDCEAYPCLALVESWLPRDELVGALRRHFSQAHFNQFSMVEAPNPGTWRVVLEQRVEDVSIWDLYLQKRKLDFEVLAQTPEPMMSDHPEAREPILWVEN